MKVKNKIFSILILIFSLLYFGVNNVYATNEKVYLGGMTAGFSLYTRGATVVGLCDVITIDGISSPSKKAGIIVGDIILSIDNNDVNSAKDIENIVKSNKEVKINVDRNGENFTFNLVPAKDVSGQFKLGVFIRDCINGIGTVTYIKNDKFASLGHPVINNEGALLKIISGKMFPCYITSVIKGERGKAGELRGVFDRSCEMAKIENNCENGVYGTVCKNNFATSNLKEIEIGSAKIGDATIYSTIDGDKICSYRISIIKVDVENKQNKNFVVKITDKKLIDKTGGIVQGMSGSPIVQDGKLVGAITHVFINDPSRGFGIDICNMINN